MFYLLWCQTLSTDRPLICSSHRFSVRLAKNYDKINAFAVLVEVQRIGDETNFRRGIRHLIISETKQGFISINIMLILEIFTEHAANIRADRG